MLTLVFVLSGYLCGSLPFGLIVGQLKGVDLRTKGSGNIGASNAGRALGRRWGFLVFCLDFLKGFAPVYAFVRWNGGVVAADAMWLEHLAWMVVASACILGHVFPIYLRFQGGKGVATSLGVLLGIPYFVVPALLALGIWIALALTTRYLSVASMTAAVAFPVLLAVITMARSEVPGDNRHLWPIYLFAVGIATLVVYRHRGNIRRLRAGTELRVKTLRGSDNRSK